MKYTDLPIPIQDRDQHLAHIGSQNHEENHDKEFVSLH